jgi:hypothetical protein
MCLILVRRFPELHSGGAISRFDFWRVISGVID